MAAYQPSFTLEFSKLYNIVVSEDHEDREQEEFRHTMYEHKQQLETVHRENFNVYLNEDINFQEVLYAVRKVKLNLVELIIYRM